MKAKLAYIERKLQDFVSIERVFKTVSDALPDNKYSIENRNLPFGSSFSGIIKNLFGLRRPVADIYHITGHVHFISLLFSSRRTILTIHDLRILHTSSGLRGFVLRKLFLDWPLRKLRYVTAISEATKNDIVEFSGCDPVRIRVIENPLTVNAAGIEKPAFNSACPRILQVGTEPHKNLDNVIEAIIGVDCHLEVIGTLTAAQTELLEQNEVSYNCIEKLDDDQMRSKFVEADILVFCSTFEGFGLPIIEAQALGTPVITSNIDPMKSVAGDGAEIVDPDAPDEIREAIKRLAKNERFRLELVEKGKKNTERFEPAKIAQKYHKLYQELLENIYS